jgi:tRNA pseudouridine55 synthase
LMEHPTDGIMLVDKTEGETSFDVVRRARGVFQTRKVGHAGTLDPFASGLLIILLGQGTKLSNFLMSQKKLYQGTLLLGVETDTLDVTGRTTETRPVHELERDEVLEKCRSLVGEIEQSPPLYSALRWKGQRAYKLARKGVDFDLPKRKVTIESLDVVFMNLPYVTIRTRCSAGTYVRSLAADIGSSLGTGAHLVSLRRLASGRFLSDQALASERLNRDLSPVVLKDRVIPLNQSLPDMEKWDVDASMARRIRQGYQPAWKELPFGPCILNGRDGYVKIVKEEELIAVMSIQIQGVQGGPRTKLMRVFE